MLTSMLLSTMMLAYPAPRQAETPDKGPGYLGVTFQGADEEGVLITDVLPTGPASGSGLRPNDIIRKFNGEPIQFDSFAKKIIRLRPGTVVPMDVERGGERVIVRVKIGVRPEDFPWPLPDVESQQLPEAQPELPIAPAP